MPSIKQADRNVRQKEKAEEQKRRIRARAQSADYANRRRITILAIEDKAREKVDELHANNWPGGRSLRQGVLRRGVVISYVGRVYFRGAADEWRLHVNSWGELYLQRVIDLDGVDAPQELKRCKLWKISSLSQLCDILDALER